MSVRRLLIALAAVLIIAALLVRRTAPEPGFENVVVIFIDTLNRGELPAYASEAQDLNAFESFADNARVMDRAYSTASWTLPAFASMLTGRYPDRHGLISPDRRLSEGMATLADYLREADFETVAFTEGGFTSPDYGLSKGFDRYEVPEKRYANQGRKERLNDPFDRGMEYLRSRPSDNERGLFLLMHTYIVHDYFLFHPWALDRVNREPTKPTEAYTACLVGLRPCSDEDWELLHDLYKAELFEIDVALQELMDTLDESGYGEDTLVILVSDHGEGFDPDRSRIHHGGRLHEDQIRVPMLISGPGIAPGRSDAPVSLIDLTPTVLDLLDVSVASLDVDGVSFARNLTHGESLSERALYAMEYFHYWRKKRRFDSKEIPAQPLSIAVIRDDDWYIQTGKAEELYDMKADPLQADDLAGDSQMVVELRAKAEIRQFLLLEAPTLERSEELTEELRALGYIN